MATLKNTPPAKKSKGKTTLEPKKDAKNASRKTSKQTEALKAELLNGEELSYEDEDGNDDDSEPTDDFAQDEELGEEIDDPSLSDPSLPALPLTLLSGNSRGTTDALHMYLREIGKFSLLEPEEELSLARRVQETGDPDAAFRLISSHLRLVVRIAMDFQRRWMQNVLDLVQEGNVGLIKAVSKFDPEKGIKFSYYAAFWIKAYILKFIMDNWRMVKIGTTQNQRKLFYNLNKERQALMDQGFTPDAEMLAKRLDVTPDQVVEMQQRLGSYDLSLDAPINEEDSGSSTKMDYLPALGPGIEEVLNDNQMATLVQERLKDLYPHLSDKEQYILANRLLSDDPITLREIGEYFSITRERVRQIEARLLQKVRDHLFKNISDFSKDWIQ